MMFLPIFLSLYHLFAQLLFGGQVKLVFTCMDVGIFGKCQFDQFILLAVTQQNSNAWFFIILFDIAVKVIHIHLHLPQILMGEFTTLEVNDHIAMKQTVVENQIYIKMIIVKAKAFLSRFK